ncbi:MAG TPA: class I SAM-dependent methyltransferase [Euzebyales bacterium]|nr:class I SAM-dependent methyltransferase [Euzebyales bacterium]
MERTVRDEVAPDGSPVAVYLAMPPHDALDLVADQVPPGGLVLDLGCGVGRLANALAARGVMVTGVDAHAGMVAHLSPTVEAVRADILDLDLRRTFDVVVLASHLVNHPTAAPAYLAACRRHVRLDGAVLVERFHPTLLDGPDEQEGEVGGVHVRHEVRDREGGRFSASAHYTVGGRAWTQHYEAVLLDDAAIATLLDDAGLAFVDWLDDDARWLLAERVDAASPLRAGRGVGQRPGDAWNGSGTSGDTH